MLQRIFLEDYFKNPFLWWGFFIFGLLAFNSHPISFMILKTIIFQQLYVPILYGLFSATFFIAFYPIQESLAKLYHEFNERLEALLYFGIIAFLLFIQVVFFLPDAMVIFSKLQPQVINNQLDFKTSIDLKLLFDFLAIPLLYAFELMIIKRGLLKRFLGINNSIRNNSRLAIFTIAIGIFAYVSHIIRQNPWQ